MTSPPRRNLTIYYLRDEIAGAPLTQFDQAIREESLESPNLIRYELEDPDEFEAELFLLFPTPAPPSWVDLLIEGFAGLDVPDLARIRSVLVLRFPYYNKDRYFALTFGHGRYLLRSDAYIPTYGLKAALNIVYEGDDPAAPTAPSRVRTVDAKTVEAQTFRMRRQASQYTTFEAFGLDVRRDLLNAVTGEPMKPNEWGHRVGGSDALHLSVKISFSGLGSLCKRIWQVQRRDDYQARFAWIDNVKPVADHDLAERLEARLLEALKERNAGTLELSPPEIIEWDRTPEFSYSTNRQEVFPDLRLADYLDVLEADDKLEPLNSGHLRRSHRVVGIDGDGVDRYPWPVFRCLDGEVALDGRAYLLSDGDFFEVAPAYLSQLDEFIGGLDESDVVLPPSPIQPDGKEQVEGDYNEEAANSSDQYLLLDKETVRVATHTSPIEICDVLTTDRKFVHVKRKLASSSLSHLFGQGSVSADLFLMSEEYRAVVHQRVQQAEVARAAADNDASFANRFTAPFRQPLQQAMKSFTR